MSLIDNIVNINISRTAVGLSGLSLNRLMILGNANKNAGVRSKLYSSLSAVAEDYITTSPEYLASKVAFSQANKPSNIMIGQAFEGETFAEAYTKVAQDNNDFYGVCLLSKDIDIILSVADLVEADTTPRIFGTSSVETDVDNVDKIYKKLSAKSYMRTFAIYSNDAVNYPECGIIAYMFAEPAGSATWSYKKLSGINVDSSISTNDTLMTKITAGNYNAIVKELGFNLFYNGKMVSGEWIDAVQVIDWIRINMQTSIMNMLTNNKKIGFDLDGLNAVEACIQTTLIEAVNNGLLEKESIVITIPKPENISATDKAERKLKNVTWEAKLLNAVHAVNIYGTISN